MVCHRAQHRCHVNSQFLSQLNKKRELEGQIADLKTDLVPLDKQLEDMLATSRRQTNTLLWLGTLVCASMADTTTLHGRGGVVC